MIERRQHSKRLLREMRDRAQDWSALEITAVIRVLEGVLHPPLAGSEPAVTQVVLPEGGGPSPACPPEETIR